MEPSPSLHPKLQLPLTPIMNRQRKSYKQNEFVLDCTNPFQSRMHQYVPYKDPYTQPYLSVLLSKVQRENTSPSLDFKIRKKTPQAVSSEDFKNFLSSKINAIKNKNSNTSHQNERGASLLSSCQKRSKLKTKQSQFVQSKYRCFLSKGSTKKKQHF